MTATADRMDRIAATATADRMDRITADSRNDHGGQDRQDNGG
jgi:hypothetical protein